ncbi:MAG: type II toxin-antitoxin system VapC family toxin, partial [Candidatus Woesearchaeota archaeon]|nr:type II toxin-antitoxin system VapC family toxin [Candidatus Woesearchaeota archaeon]
MICLETTTVIDYLNDVSEAKQIINSQRDNILCVTSITIFEVLYGTFVYGGIEEAQAFFQELIVLPLAEREANASAKIQSELSKKGLLMQISDVLIAGTCIANNCTQIITRDK